MGDWGMFYKGAATNSTWSATNSAWSRPGPQLTAEQRAESARLQTLLGDSDVALLLDVVAGVHQRQMAAWAVEMAALQQTSEPSRAMAARPQGNEVYAVDALRQTREPSRTMAAEPQGNGESPPVCTVDAEVQTEEQGGPPRRISSKTPPTPQGPFGTSKSAETFFSGRTSLTTPDASARNVASRFLRKRTSLPDELNVRSIARRLLHWHGFEFFMGTIIIVNAICIGIETQMVLDGSDTTVMFAFECLFLAIYIIELSIRVAALGYKIVTDSWVRLDAGLVALGLLALGAELEAGIGKQSIFNALDQLMILRLLRLLRLVRAVRMLGRWETLWKLVNGFRSGFVTLASTFAVLGIAVYIYAIVAAELISRNADLRAHPDTAEIVEDSFSDIPNIIMTLCQFISVDGLAEVYKPLIHQKWYLSIYFVLIFLSISILAMNLVTAVLVDDAIARSQMDERMQLENKRRQYKAMVPLIQEAFRALDADGSGEVAMTEIVGADFSQLGGDKFTAVAHYLRPEVIADLYDVLDQDGSGAITEDELVEGISQLALAETSFEIAQVKSLLNANSKRMKQMKVGIERILGELQARR